MDFCDLIYRLRSHFFAKDRDMVLQTGRIFSGEGGVPVGIIILWSGAVVDIPDNWQLCDGSNGTPDLRNSFVVGAGSGYAVGASGGADTNDLAHTHTSGTYTTDSDSHRHSGTGTTSGNYIYDASGYPTDWDTHSHDVTGSSGSSLSAAQENRPPYYALAYIQRIS